MNTQFMADFKSARAEFDANSQVAQAVDTLSRRMDELACLMEEQVHLQRVALLEEGHILRFRTEAGQRIALSLPEAQSDDRQRMILQDRSFHDARLLGDLQAEGIVTPGSAVLDVGAGIGDHSVFFAAIMGAERVIAFEAQRDRFATLHRNIALNDLGAQVTAINALVGAEGGRVRLAPGAPGSASYAPDPAGDVPVVALDEVVGVADIARIDLIRIGPEGMALPVLQGAEMLLIARFPALLVEFRFGEADESDAKAFLGTLGYRWSKLSATSYLFQAG